MKKQIVLVAIFSIIAVVATTAIWFLLCKFNARLFNFEAKEKETVQILFAGDLMFDRGIRYYAAQNKSNEFIFEKLKKFLAQSDLVAVNLEGPITANKSVSSGTAPGSPNNYYFTFDPSLAQTLFNENIRLVGLGNNHILNFGVDGLEQTKKYLDQVRVDYFGLPGQQRSIVKELQGLKIAFVGYNEFYGDAASEKTQALEEIKMIRPQADVVIIFCHWGAEYRPEPEISQIELAHKFIDAGADLIIGSHPHVVQTIEDYKGPDGQSKRIYYSLGNFIFDQYFQEDVRKGLGVVLKINKNTKELSFEEKHFYLASGGQTILGTGEAIEKNEKK